MSVLFTCINSQFGSEDGQFINLTQFYILHAQKKGILHLILFCVCRSKNILSILQFCLSLFSFYLQENFSSNALFDELKLAVILWAFEFSLSRFSSLSKLRWIIEFAEFEIFQSLCRGWIFGGFYTQRLIIVGIITLEHVIVV